MQKSSLYVANFSEKTRKVLAIQRTFLEFLFPSLMGIAVNVVESRFGYLLVVYLITIVGS